MRRRLFTVVSAVSLLLCLATVALWVRGYGPDSYRRRHSSLGVEQNAVVTRGWEVRAEYGQIELLTMHAIWRDLRNLDQFATCGESYRSPWSFIRKQRGLEVFTDSPDSRYPPDACAWRDFDGSIRSERSSDGTLVSWMYLRFPSWLPTVCFLAMPLMTVKKLWASRSRRPGHCVCGYDLVANTSGVCPECGSPVAKKAEGMA